MRLIPLFDQIILRQIHTQNQHGVILPDSISESPSVGEVLYVGTGGRLDGNEIEIILKKGDKVLFHKYTASEFFINDESLYIIKQSDILCIMEDENE